MIPDRSEPNATLKITSTLAQTPRPSWLVELETKALQLWENGEGDLKIEIRNSRTDANGRRKKFVKIEANAITRWEE